MWEYTFWNKINQVSFFVVVFIKSASGFLTLDDIISLYPLCYIYWFNVDGEALSFLMLIV